MNVETYTQPPEPEIEEEGDDLPASRLGVHFLRVDDTHLDASVQLFGDDAEDPQKFAEALLSATLALAQLAGPDHWWATLQRLAAYDGTANR